MNTESLKKTVEKMVDLLETQSLGEKTESRVDAYRPPKRETETERISPVADAMFKAIFLNEANKDLTAKLISELIGIDYEYLLENMTFYKNEVNKKGYEDKNRRVDLMIRLGTKYIGVEMNNKSRINRNFMYAIKTAMVENKVGDMDFSPIIEINFNNYFYRDLKKPICYYAFIPIDQKYQNHTAEKLIIIEIYLPLIRKKCYTELNKAEKIILAMFETSKEKAKELTEGDEILMRYNEKVEEAQRDEELLQAYDHDEVHFELGKEEGIKMGIAQGITQGITQGIAQKQLEVISNMMDEGFGKETIAKCLKMDMDELEKVLLKINEN